MSFLIASSEALASAATGLADIGTTISAAHGAASPATTGLLPAAADEVSQAVAALFSGHGQQFQALSAKVALFHDQFVQTLTGGAASYTSAEAANVSPLRSLLAAPANPVNAALQQIQQTQLGFTGGLVNGELAFNNSLLTHEVGLEQSLFGTDSALNGVINRGFNAGNLLLGTGEQTFNSLVGAQVPATFWSSLLTGSGAQVFNGGQIGGLVGAFDQGLAGSADAAGLLLGNTSASASSALSGYGVAAAANPVNAALLQIQQTQLGFTGGLVNGELGLNNSLLTHEVGLEQRIFGTDSALNGALNRGFNAGNLLLGTGEQTFNSLVGAQVPATFWSSLLTGSEAQVFNGGQIGGLLGVVDQNLADSADFGGVLLGSTSAASVPAALASAHAGVSALAPASVLQQLQQTQLGFTSGLVNGELGFNHSLLTNEVGLEQRVFGTDSALNGVLNRGFNEFNLLLGTGEQTADSLLGVQMPTGFTAGLLTGSGAQVFNGGQIGGLEGVFDQSLAGSADFAGLLVGNGSAMSAASSLVNGSAAQAVSLASPASVLQQLQQTEIGFNTNLVNGQLGLNHSLLTNEVGLEQQVFGTDSALNGVLNRGFNEFNLLLGTGEQTADSLLGAQVPAGFTASLLTGSGAQVFNGGQIGGLLGVFDQSLAGSADFAGLLLGDT